MGVLEGVEQIVAAILPEDARLDRDVPLRRYGLDSIMATRLVLELRCEYGIQVPLDWLAEGRTVTDLAELISTGDATAPNRAPAPVAGQRHEPFPLTPMQQAYLLGKLGSDPIGCHVYREFTIPGLDVERLRAAWARVVAHHDALRVVITGDGRQAVMAQPPPVAITQHPDTDHQAVRQRLAAQRYPAGARPMHAVEVSGQTVHLSIDASIVDGRGLSVILDDWRRWYEDPGYEPAASPSLREAVLRLEATCAGNQEAKDYWAQRLDGMPGAPRLPMTDATQPGWAPFDGALTATQWTAVRDLADRWGVSPTSLVLCVFADTLFSAGTSQSFSLVLTTSDQMQLPDGGDGLVGCFTSTAVLVLDRTLDMPLADAAREVHATLWRDLSHAAIPGVVALRDQRTRTGQAPPELPVVFTSLLDERRDRATGPESGWAASYGASQTTGVVLDHQMWEHEGELRFRWDMAVGRLAPGAPEALFARFQNALEALVSADAAQELRPLNELQKAYYVSRSAGPSSWDGCQVYHGFRVPGLDPARMEKAWLRLVSAYEALRATVTHDGRLAISPQPPQRWHIPVTSQELQPGVEMVSRAFPLGRLPQAELRITGEVVHLSLDLTVLDGRSIHLLMRRLLKLYDDPTTPIPPAAPYAALPGARQEASRDHWRARLATLPPGPPMLGGADRRRICLHGKVSGEFTDADVLSALAGALAQHFTPPFALPVVRWLDSADPSRPGEFTALSWVRDDSDFARVLHEDAQADSVSGLAELRRTVMKERRTRSFAYPVVYTGILRLAEHRLPQGFTAQPWLTCTPDVSLDCVCIDDGTGVLRYFWDIVPADFAPGIPQELFSAFESLLAPGSSTRDTTSAAREPTPEFGIGPMRHAPAHPVHLLFEQQAARTPGAVAVRTRHGNMTYGELNAAANRIAWALKKRNLPAQTPVGICLTRDAPMVAAVFGVLKAGCAYLPVEPALPAERAALMLADTASPVLIADPVTLGWPAPEGVDLLDITRLDGGDSSNPPATGTPDDLAYLIFTSGSTGRPKCVAVTHRPVCNLLDWCYREFHFGPDDIGLCVTSLGFDLSAFDILGLLGRGASLYLADEAEQKDPGLLLDVMIRQRVTFWNSAPTTLSQLAPLFPVPASDDLRLIFLSGDFTPLSLPGDIRRSFPNAQLVNLGGATEATVWSNWYRVGDIDPGWQSIPYGKPIQNARYYILDPSGQPCPPEVVGELYIAGPVLASGYYRQPDLTAERFLPDPFQTGGSMYRTGDLAHFFADGNMCFRGRVDNQVKIRGFRVELGEIEHRLREHPAVKDAVVLARPDASGDRKLVAYVIAVLDPPDVKELRAHAAQTLPHYMVPNFVTLLPAFPATANGKLDRDALPWPIDTAPDPAPPSAMRDDLTALFCELLGAPVDPDADLWDQGATSFTMVQVSGALQSRHGRRVPVAALLSEPTITGIARALGEPVAPVPVPAPVASPEPVAVSPAGSRLEERSTDRAASVLSRQQNGEAASPGITAPAAPAQVDLLDDRQREAFKATDPGTRTLAGPLTPLPVVEFPESFYQWRSSRRDFASGPVPVESLGRLLSVIRRTPKMLYPSAGDTYAVQTYVHVRSAGVSGLAAGVYYYRPAEHALELITDAPQLSRTAHFFYNRPVFDRSAFEIYLIGELDGIRPLYGDDALRFLTLEAGYMGQALMMGQASCGVGLCPVGSVAQDAVCSDLALGDGHVFLQSFLGGREVYNGQSFLDDRPTGEAAVVGMSGHYPGAPDLDTFWRNLSTGTRSIAPVPAGGLGDDFDSLMFHISPNESDTLDPQLKLLLRLVWTCLDDAGHTARSLSAAGRVGVFVGSMWADHQHSGADRWRGGDAATIFAGASEIANRISHFFDFSGPSIAVDTSCSSALTALHMAVESLRRGDCDAAVVAAANLVSHPYHLELLHGLGLTAPTQTAGAFDGESSGWTVGEGGGALLLRPLSRAGGDTVHAIVEATGIAHAGRSARYAAPRAEGLVESLRMLLANAGLGPSDIDYIECAAAGASMADAAEIEALATLFQDVRVGTVKPNIGHLESASGMSQLAKAVLQLHHGRIAPTLVAPRRSGLIAWDTLPLTVAQEAAALPSGARILVNALGATGSYAHAILRAAS